MMMTGSRVKTNEDLRSPGENVSRHVTTLTDFRECRVVTSEDEDG